MYKDIYSIYTVDLEITNKGERHMKLYKDAFFLFSTELKRSMFNVFMILGLIIFSLLLGASTYLNILDASHPTFNDTIDFLGDYTFFLSFCCIGVLTTFIYGGGFKRDILADRLAYYRSLPISSEHIVLSKIIGAIITLFVGFTVYFLAIVSAFVLFAGLEFKDMSYAYIVHIILLFALMLVSNYIFIWVDLCKSYKWYTIFSFIIVFVCLSLTITITTVTKNESTFLIAAYRISESHPILVVIVSILVIIVSTWLTFIGVTKALKKRNLG